MISNKQFGTLVGSFGKGVKGSATVNFTVSGGDHCDDSCSLKGNGCYAVTTEAVKPSITVNLEKKQAALGDYLSALGQPKVVKRLQQAPWIRFAAFGSVKAPHLWTLDEQLKARQLAAQLPHETQHFPTETKAKYDHLTSMGFNPRLSLGETTGQQVALEVSSGRKVSVVVEGPKLARGKNKRVHSGPAFDMQKELLAQGIKAKVCPAVSGNAKCGDCTMCAQKDTKVIIYPKH